MALTNAPLVAAGLKSLSIAPLAKISAAVPVQIGYVKKGSVKLNFDAPTVNPVEVEELDMSIFNKFEVGKKNIELDIPNVEKSFLTLLGCTVTTGVTEDTIAVPDGVTVLTKMVKFEFMSGLHAMWFTNAQIVWNFTGGIQNAGSDTFDIHLIITPNAGLGGATYEANGVMLTSVGTGA